MSERTEQLTTGLLDLGRMVEAAIGRSITALQQRDHHLAEAVIQEDERIDEAEVQLEKLCIEILEKEQPTGFDLRFVVAVLKINDCLERMGDLAENIAKTVVFVAKNDAFVRLGGCRELAERSQKMLKNCLKALIDRDTKLARRVIEDDHQVDALQKTIIKRIEQEMDSIGFPAQVLMRMEYVTRQLERISDLATNVAEDVIYMIDGQIIRHPSRFKANDSTVSDGSATYRRVS